MTGLAFDLLARDGAARRGRLETARGVVDTPAFMPVGTAGTVKGVLPEQVAASGAQIVLGNTYHLMLRPGAERVADLGGLHRFMNWPGPIRPRPRGPAGGVTYTPPKPARRHQLPRAPAVEIQHLLDADITMVLDECTPYPASEEEARQSTWKMATGDL